MSNNGIVNIHGKDYMTVARRLELAHENNKLESVETEVLSNDPVVVRAKVIVSGKAYTGTSAVSPQSSRIIEKQNPYEVAETSAVGRALGFAGFGVIEAVASADDMIRATAKQGDAKANGNTKEKERTCLVCGQSAVERQGISKGGKPFHGIFCTTEDKSHTVWL